MRQPGALRDLRPGHPLHQPKDERFAVSLRKGTDQGQNHFSLQLGGAVGRSALGLILGNGVGNSLGRNLLAEVVICSVPRDGAQPRSKARNIAQRMEPPQRQEENFLDEVIHFARGDSSEKNAVDHARIAVVEAPEGGAITIASGADERVVFARFGDRPDGHSLTFHP